MTTHLHHLHAVDQPDTELRCRHLAAQSFVSSS